MPTVLDDLYMPQQERERRQREESRRRREDLLSLASARNHPITGQIRERAQATAEASQAAEEERQRQQAEAREAAFRDRIRAVYIESGGSPEGFAADWPGLRSEIVRRQTLAAAEEINPREQPPTGARRALSQMYPIPPR